MSASQALSILSQLRRPDTFREFIVRTAGGGEFKVEGPDRLALPSNPSAGTFAVYIGGYLHIVNLELITSIEVAR